MSSKQKSQGRKWEKYWVSFFAKLFSLTPRRIDKKTKLPNSDWEICRAEEVSQVFDNLGIDIALKDFKKFPFSVQIKSTTTKAIKSKPIDVQPLMGMKELEDTISLLCTSVLYVKKGNKRRSHYGDFITIKAEDFEKLLNLKLKEDEK